jgi:ketosteroid isomerase-like protein
MTSSVAALADQLLAASEPGGAVQPGIFAPEVVVRHMTGDLVEHRAPRDGVAAALTAEAETFRRLMPDFEYADTRRIVGDDAFVIIQTLKGTPQHGPPVFVPMCAVFTVEDGMIAAIDAYMDSVHEAVYVALLSEASA